MFNNIKVDYRRLLPSASGEDDGVEDNPSLGIYEDQESQQERREQEEGLTCPAWCNDCLPSLSFSERLLGCATCMICGYLLSMGSFLRMRDLLGGNPTPLVLNVTIGNIVALCGTCFLTGPEQQARNMLHKSRKLASICYLGSLGVTLLLLILPHHKGKGLLLFTLLIFQYVAITWYCLSYIPFARNVVKRLCRRIVSSVDEDEG